MAGGGGAPGGQSVDGKSSFALKETDEKTGKISHANEVSLVSCSGLIQKVLLFSWSVLL